MKDPRKLDRRVPWVLLAFVLLFSYHSCSDNSYFVQQAQQKQQ